MSKLDILFKSLKNKTVFEEMLVEIEKIRKTSEILNLQAQPTGYSWLGVYNAGLSLFPKCTVAIPQEYSNQVLTNKQLQLLGNFIGELKFSQIIYNGYNSYFTIISQEALKKYPPIKIKLIYHGFFAELAGNPVLNKIIEQLVEDVKCKRIHLIGFVKKGNSEVFEKLFNVSCQLIYYKNPELIPPKHINKSIGVLTNQSFRKNTTTQIIAALILKQYNVSIFNSDDCDVFDDNQKLIKLPLLSHKEFLNTLSMNLINSHVTFSEASGGQVFTESLAVGVPCLTSLTHGYLDDSEELRKALLVERFDDSWAIAQKMEEVIADRERLSKLGIEYSQQMNQKADEFLSKFLEF